MIQTVKETTLFLGPQHPGITGNMMIELKIVGDTIKKATTHVGYLHRGFEKLMEERLYIQCFPIVCRICVPEPDPNEENFARGVEELAGIEIPERAKWIRTMVLELSRIQAYLLWMGGQSASVGLYTMPQWTIGDRDYILDLFEDLTGGRVYHMYIWPGGVRRDLPKGFRDKALKTMDYLESRLPDYDRLLFENAMFLKRAQGIGVIEPEKALEWGVVGPPLRASGHHYDIRIDDPYEKYPEVDFIVPTRSESDVYARAMIRRFEIGQSISIVRQVLDKLPEGDVYEPIPNPFYWKVPKGDAYVRTESARGEFAYYVVSDGSTKPRRVHARGPAFVHGVSLLEDLLIEQNIADVSMIMNSLGTCPPEIER
ncbi:MAG: NADH-quinone oxidoreductase subunit D [Calditrichaeota bacterium]|nr:NADH-quinone oxidoreductase subunit D [Calditrichota bacterium]